MTEMYILTYQTGNYRWP